jgi:tRNA A-37 threonylcarbamoyl transferase component Bud32
MTPERWQQLKDLYHSALELDPAQRTAFLDRACEGDEALRRELDSLIATNEQQDSFLELPALAQAASVLAGTQSTLVAGQRVGRYTVLAPLGAGGMGEVFLAEDTRLGRRVALKLLPSELARDAERRARFEQEARAASALNHPNVCAIYEVGESEDGRHFIAMEYVEGQTLRARLDDSGLELTEALEIAVQVAGALSAAHEAGVVHRDVKPENLMLRPDGYVKVLDFGLAKLTEQRTTDSVPTWALVETSTGVVMGTARYMSPEQARGLAVDARTDLWSLGAVLYELVTGHAPFDGATTSDVLVAILEREPAPLSRFMADVPAALEWIVTKALRKEREERYQTVKGLLADLKRLRHRQEVEAEREPSRQPDGSSGAAAPARGTPAATASAGEPAVGTGERQAAHRFGRAGYLVRGASRAPTAACCSRSPRSSWRWQASSGRWSSWTEACRSRTRRRTAHSRE